MSGCPRCSSTRPIAASRFASAGPSTFGWATTVRPWRVWAPRRPRPAFPSTCYIFGEERHSRGVARAIVAARKEAPITTPRALADIVSRVVRSKPGEIHPATRTFQALRIFVNEELDELHLALSAAESVLKPGGRLVVVSFHSLEDRIVKNFFAQRAKAGGGSRHLPEVAHAAPSFIVLTKRPVTPDDAEISANPRARSAKLRAAERTAAPAHAAAALPAWPSLDDVMRGG